jgi:hypothetical protein
MLISVAPAACSLYHPAAMHQVTLQGGLANALTASRQRRSTVQQMIQPLHGCCCLRAPLQEVQKMATSPRSVLLMAALALLLVTASCNRRRPRRSPAPDVFTFGWAPISTDYGNDGARSCDRICAK